MIFGGKTLHVDLSSSFFDLRIEILMHIIWIEKLILGIQVFHSFSLYSSGCSLSVIPSSQPSLDIAFTLLYLFAYEKMASTTLMPVQIERKRVNS